MWHANQGPWCFGFLFFILVFGFFIVRAFAFRNFGGYRRGGWNDESDAILRKRLANGEIDEEEYQKLKNALKK
jgi:uncharacterized membrane protein